MVLVETDFTAKQEDFARIYERTNNQVYNHVFSRTGNPAIAEDLTSDVFINAWVAYSHGKYSEQGKPLAWLMVIATNRLTDHYREQSIHRQEYLTDDKGNARPFIGVDSDDWDDKIEKSEQVRSLVGAINRLNSIHKKVIIGRFLLEKDYNQIAADIGRTYGATRVTNFRALAALRKQLIQNSE